MTLPSFYVPEEAQLSTIPIEPCDSLTTIERIHRFAWEARGFLGLKRFYCVAISETFGEAEKVREIKARAASASIEDLLRCEYREIGGRFRAARRDVERYLWGKIPVRVRVWWNATFGRNRVAPEDDVT